MRLARRSGFIRIVMRGIRPSHLIIVSICICSILVAGCDRRPKEYAGIADTTSNEEIDPHSN
jgi:hypothetical protein